MNTGVAHQIGGRFCVVVKIDGTSEVKEISAHDKIFEEAKSIIGCMWLDHVIVQNLVSGVRLSYLVNDEGYIDWGNDPTKVNQIATFLYNRGQKPGHYILGDVVFCLEVEGDDGGEFWGMCKPLAKKIAKSNNDKVLSMAKEVVPMPTVVPDPVVTISSFDSTDDLIRAMQGDKTVKPTKVETIGGDATTEAKAD